MRVLHVFKTYLPETAGGVERVIGELCENAPDTGVIADVAALVPGPVDESPQAVAHHRLVPFRRHFEIAATGFSADFLGRFPRIAAEYDILHYHFPWPFMDLVHIARGIRTPFVITYHSDIVRQAALMRLYRPLMRAFLARAARIVATSHNYARTSAALSSRDPAIVPLGISERLYPAAETTDRIRPIVEAGAPYVLSVGVNRHYKGFATLIAAAAGLPVRIVLASAGPRAAALEADIARSGAANVTLVRDASEGEKMALLRNCTAFALPSVNRAEAYGVSLVEAAMAGRPLICCEIGTGTTFVNIDTVTGLVVPPGDADALRKAIDTLCRDGAMAARMGRAARARYESELTGEEMARRYAMLYADVLRSGRLP